MTFASEGGLENWNDLDCIDLSSSHWYESARENLAMPNGELYAMDGDISYNSLDSAGVMFFNEDLLANYGINNVYDKIANGTWTMEAFLSMVKDIDNPSGYVTLRSQAPLLAARSTGRSVVRNGGQYVFNWDNERTVSFMDDFLSVIKQTNIVTVNSTSDSTALLNNFLDGNAVFTDSSYGSIKEMKDINFSVGMAPWPKADVNDDGYTASVNAATTLYTIPYNSYERIKMTSIVLDGFAKEGQKTLMKDYYYNQVLMRYCTSANMYDCAVLIHNSLTYDIGVMGNFSNAIAQLPATSYSSGTFASNVAAKSSQINAYILEWNTTFP